MQIKFDIFLEHLHDPRSKKQDCWHTRLAIRRASIQIRSTASQEEIFAIICWVQSQHAEAVYLFCRLGKLQRKQRRS